MLIYIAEAGAMGCRFGYQISKRNHKVILLDNWKEHVDSIKKHDLQIAGDTEDTVHLPIMAPTEATEKADVIILFTKAMQLEGMLQNIQQIIDKDTKFLCLLNGLGHEDVVRKYVSDHNILMGVTVWTASINGPGKEFYKAQEQLIYRVLILRIKIPELRLSTFLMKQNWVQHMMMTFCLLSGGRHVLMAR